MSNGKQQSRSVYAQERQQRKEAPLWQRSFTFRTARIGVWVYRSRFVLEFEFVDAAVRVGVADAEQPTADSRAA